MTTSNTASELRTFKMYILLMQFSAAPIKHTSSTMDALGVIIALAMISSQYIHLSFECKN